MIVKTDIKRLVISAMILMRTVFKNISPGCLITLHKADQMVVQCCQASLFTVLKRLKCAIITHDCHKKADCINTVGDYECYCRYGYATVAMGKGLVTKWF